MSPLRLVPAPIPGAKISDQFGLVFSAPVRRLNRCPRNFVATTMLVRAWSDAHPAAKIYGGCDGLYRPAHSGDLRDRADQLELIVKAMDLDF